MALDPFWAGRACTFAGGHGANTVAPRRTPATRQPRLSDTPDVISSQAYGSDHRAARCPRRQPCCNRSPREGSYAGDPEKCTGVRGPHPPLWPPGGFWYFSPRRKVRPQAGPAEKRTLPQKTINIHQPSWWFFICGRSPMFQRRPRGRNTAWHLLRTVTCCP